MGEGGAAAYPKSSIRCRFRCPVSIFKTPESSSRRALRGGQIGGLREPQRRRFRGLESSQRARFEAQSQIRSLRGPQRAIFEAQRARSEASEALREPDVRLSARFEASGGRREPQLRLRKPDLRPQSHMRGLREAQRATFEPQRASFEAPVRCPVRLKFKVRSTQGHSPITQTTETDRHV